MARRESLLPTPEGAQGANVNNVVRFNNTRTICGDDVEMDNRTATPNEFDRIGLDLPNRRNQPTAVGPE